MDAISVTDVTKGRLVVLGGCASGDELCFTRALRLAVAPRRLTPSFSRSNGFVGTAVCKAAAAAGLAVVSVSRCGDSPRPATERPSDCLSCAAPAAPSALHCPV